MQTSLENHLHSHQPLVPIKWWCECCWICAVLDQKGSATRPVLWHDGDGSGQRCKWDPRNAPPVQPQSLIVFSSDLSKDFEMVKFVITLFRDYFPDTLGKTSCVGPAYIHWLQDSPICRLPPCVRPSLDPLWLVIVWRCLKLYWYVLHAFFIIAAWNVVKAWLSEAATKKIKLVNYFIN